MATAIVAERYTSALDANMTCQMMWRGEIRMFSVLWTTIECTTLTFGFFRREIVCKNLTQENVLIAVFDGEKHGKQLIWRQLLLLLMMVVVVVVIFVKENGKLLKLYIELRVLLQY